MTEGDPPPPPPGSTRPTAAAPTDVERSANLLAALAVHVADRVFDATNRETGRSTAETGALVVIAMVQPGLSPEALGAVLGASPAAVASLVDHLAEHGLVVRHLDPSGRPASLTATRPGHRVAIAALESGHQSAAAVLAALDPAEQQVLTGLLEKLLAGATRSHADAARICRLCTVAVCHDIGRCPVTDAACRQDPPRVDPRSWPPEQA